jgi:FtsP/CotA-like multicopper oxidase with cupredoxin domain
MNDPKNFCLNHTNLHTHGLHISPFRAINIDGSFDENYWSDNVLLSILPGNQEKYKFQILPAGNPVGSAQMNHYPGTFWYHAHNHGSTAVQLASGMAGALIIKGDIDNYPGIKDAPERVFLFQQLAFDANGEIKRRAEMGRGDIVTAMEQNWEGNNRPVTGPPKITTINGRVNPVIKLRPGQVERWRFIDGGVFEFLDIRLQNNEFLQIAIDGITLSQVKQLDHVDMGPGYRTDVMVKAAENVPPGGATYYLYKGPTSLTFNSSRLAAAQILATIRVEGKPCNQEPMCHSTLPAGSLPAPLPDITSVDRTKSISLTSRGMMMGNAFNMDGAPYNADVVRPNFQLRKGTSEEWAITNMSMNPHPIHIHVNAFQILRREGREWKPAEWRDTIIIQPMETVRFRTRYDRFTGDFVTHCHILFHEDLGMMQRVSIRP